MKHSLRVALVVAETDSVEYLRSMLHALGHEVHSTSSSGRGLAVECSVGRPDLVVAGAKLLGQCSVNVPEANCQKCPVPVILLSSGRDLEHVQCKLDEHVLAYLVRPFTAAELETTIALVMRRFSDRQTLQQQTEQYQQALARLEKLDEVRLSVTELENKMLHRSNRVTDGLETAHSRWEQHRSSLESIPHAVQEIDTSGRITFCNAAYCRMHGYSREDLEKMNIWQLLATQEEHEVFRESLKERITRQPSPVSYQTRHRRGDGHIIKVQVDWTYMRDELGEVIGFISIITDVTQHSKDRRELQVIRKELEESTQRIGEKMAAADERLCDEIARRERIEEVLRDSKRLASIGVLSAGIAHEINNPIGAALSSAENALAMHHNLDSEAFVEECLENIVDSARRCGKIVKDLLRFASQEPTEKEVYSLNHIVSQANRAIRRVVNDSGVTLRCALVQQDCWVLANLLEMEIAVANLVQNALEAAQGHGKGDVIVRTDCSGDEARILVQDAGCGISENDLQYIFDPFFTTRKESGGTGLGLSIVYAIVHDHGGSIEVSSTVGQGTTFTLTFPLVRKDRLETEIE
ncbi:ATP-binding protein [Planctomycetota bacterium]